MAYADLKSRSPRLPSIAGVVVVHGLLGYAFISGLATTVIQKVIPTFTVTSIADTPPPPPVDPAPPPAQRRAEPQQPTRPVPVIDSVAIPDQSIVVIEPIRNVRVEEPVTTALPPEPLPPGKAASARASGNRAGWITTDDYPAAAIRAEQEGIVGISVRIGVDGRVTACSVTRSSGSPTLDAATCRLYPRRARFSAALDRAGAPIESTFADTVRWQLPRE